MAYLLAWPAHWRTHWPAHWPATGRSLALLQAASTYMPHGSLLTAAAPYVSRKEDTLVIFSAGDRTGGS